MDDPVMERACHRDSPLQRSARSILGLALAAGLAACGGGSSDPASPGSQSSSPAGPADFEVLPAELVEEATGLRERALGSPGPMTSSPY